MSARVVLEDFFEKAGVGSASMSTGAPQVRTRTSEIAAEISATYEKGFKAGWDHCLSVAEVERAKVAEAFGKRLSELNISLEEVRRQFIKELDPLFADILQKVLPMAVQKAFLPRLIEEIAKTAAQVDSGPITVSICEEDAPVLEALRRSHPTLPAFKVQIDTTLTLSQATIAIGQTERCFDLSGVLDTLEQAFEEFSEATLKVSNAS